MYSNFDDNDIELSLVGDLVQEDKATHIPQLDGELSRGFDPTFPERYFKFYNKLANNPIEAVKDLADDVVKFVEYCCRTKSRDKQTGKVTILCFELFESQKKALYEMLECWLNGEEAAFLKSRQQGASWLALCFAFWLCIFHPNQAVLCTSKSDDDLHEIGNLKSFMEKFVFLYRNLHPYLRSQIIYRFEHKRFFFQINDSTIEGGRGEDPARGGTYTCTLNDEAAANKNLRKVIDSIAACCNSNFWISTKKHRDDEYDKLLNSPAIRKIRLFWRDDPQIIDKEAYRTKYIAKFGENSFNVEIDCRYSEADVLRLFDPQMIDIIKTLRPKNPPIGDIIAGYDVAGLGSDSNVLIIRHGHSLPLIKPWNKCFAYESVDKCIECFYEYPFDILMFDEIGVGYAIASEFERRAILGQLPFQVQGIHFNSDAGEKGVDDPLLDEEERKIYFNLRSKLHFLLKDIIENTFADTINKTFRPSDILYLNDENIIKEMYHVLQDEKSVKKMKVVSKLEIKKTLGHSPNYLDALLLTYTAERFVTLREIENYLYSESRNSTYDENYFA